MLIIHCGLLLLFLSCVRTTENVYGDELARRSDFNRFSLWPSVHNAATLFRKRRSTVLHGTGTNEVAGPNEGTDGGTVKPVTIVPALPTTLEIHSPVKTVPALETNKVPKETNQTTSQSKQEVTTQGTTTIKTTDTSKNTTLSASSENTKSLDLNNPGVVKRGIIVFGGFALMAGAYFIFYKKKNQNNDMSSSLGINDANQFRYGILQNEATKDNIESSRIPLTMESEDEIDDDLEIFDLMQKKKSLSYVNLQQNDEDIVLSSRDVDIEGDNLLLDIEDASSDTLINWSNNGSKSIL